MGTRETRSPERIVRRYGMGSLLAGLSLPIAMIMARLGMNGWQRTAFEQMEKDVIDMQRRGFRVVSTDESSVPLIGVAFYVVTYEKNHPRA